MVGAIVVVILGGAAIVLLTQDRQPELATAEVARYLDGWERFDTAAMSAAVEGTPAGMAEAVTAMRRELKITAATFRTLTVEREGDEQRATYRADIEVGGHGHLGYDGNLRLVQAADETWRVAWDHAALHPDLRSDRHFAVGVTWAARAPIMGAGGTTLVSTADTVIVGLAPGRIQDLAQVQAVLARELGTDPEAVAAALEGPAEEFVPVGQLPRDRFTAARPVLEPVPGIFFRQERGPGIAGGGLRRPPPRPGGRDHRRAPDPARPPLRRGPPGGDVGPRGGLRAAAGGGPGGRGPPGGRVGGEPSPSSPNSRGRPPSRSWSPSTNRCRWRPTRRWPASTTRRPSSPSTRPRAR